MHTPVDSNTELALEYLSGGGEMGARMRALDWSRTPVGPMKDWPQSLRSALSMLLPSKAQIILFWGPEFVVFYNDPYRPVFGAKHPVALGLPGREAWSEIWVSVLHELLAGVVRTGEAFSGRDLLFTIERHGFPEDTYFDVSYDPVRDESGKVGGVYCIVTETTARVLGTRRLALLRDLGMPLAAARTAHDACQLAINAVACAEQDIAFALAYLDGELAASTPDALAALLQATADSVQRRALVRPGGAAIGSLVLGLNRCVPFDDSSRSFVQLIASQVSTAIANAQAYDDERRRAEALAALDREKTAFFSNVSHEFRTPLTLMLGPLEEMLRAGAGANRDMLRVVHRNGQRLLKLVNTLLDFARIEAGRAKASYEALDLSGLTADLASNFETACDMAGLRLEVRCGTALEAWVDREMWEKIVLNLLSNALKFTLHGSISVTLQDSGEHLKLSVADTGIGMPRDALTQVFDRFHRVEGARGRSHEGSGIGLALVQELVKLHGGTIGVESELGQGTTFTVTLPKGGDHLPNEQRAARPAEGSSTGAHAYVAEALGWLGSTEHAAQDGAADARSGHVLFADDNADLRDYVYRLLAEHYTVETAADGIAALEAARARRPDVIVTDAMMPKLDGFGLIRALRDDAELRSVPVLVLSARAGEEAKLEGLQHGADDYLVKPFSARELIGRVEALRQADAIRRKALEALRQSNAQSKALLDHAPVGAYLVDADFVMREVNPLALPVFGDIPGGVIGRDFSEIIHILWPAPFADEIVQLFRHTLATGEPYVATETSARRLDRDTTEYYDWRIDRIPLPGGRHGVVCYFRDIAEQIRARRTLEDSQAALREADRRKDEFLATLSHELRNPLAPIRNALHLLEGNHGEAIGRRALEIMGRQLNQLTRLVDDLMEVSRITRGNLELRCERVLVADIVSAAVENTDPLIRDGAHRLHVDVPKDPMWIDGDAMRLAQVLSNLLNNAAKYTSQEGVIELSARSDGVQIEIRVRDNGMGIRADVLPRVFNMFERGRGDSMSGKDGMGVGLALAKHLVELHHGTIEARSEGEDRGAEFVVRIPVAAETAGPRSATAVVST